MDPLDLRLAPPRSPREKLVGLYFLPRTVDKIRAELPGGNAGSYFVENPVGMSAYVLRKIGVDLATLREVVANAPSEDAVAEWLQANADLAHVEKLNANMQNITIGRMPDAERAVFNRFYPGAEKMPDDMRLFDVIEMDDAKLIR